MKNNRLLLLFAFAFLSVFELSAQTQNYETLGDFNHKERKDNNASITIKCNVSGAEVFLNGAYQGMTDLVISNLREGIYRLEVRKRGYETAYYTLRVKAGLDQTFSITLRLQTGYISLLNLEQGASFYIDGAVHASAVAEVPVGTHRITVRRFGYEEFAANVSVYSKQTAYVTAVYKEAAFEMKDFKLSKKTINPDYSGGIGKTEISFYVTASAPASLVVSGSDGLAVFTKRYNGFSDWNQRISWGGEADDGQTVEDGVYTVSILAQDFYFEQSVIVDRSLFYSLAGVAPLGTGTGPLQSAFSPSINFSMPYFAFSPVFRLSGAEDFSYKLPLRLGFVLNFLKCAELSLGASVFLGESSVKLPLSLNASFRMNKNMPLGSGTALNLSGFVRYGYSFVDLSGWSPVDFGNGLGGGAVLAFDSPVFYVAYSAEFIMAAATGRLGTDGSRLMKNGVSLSLHASRFSRVSAWAVLHSTFSDVVEPFAGIDTGAELVGMPFSSTLQINFRAEALFAGQGQLYLSAQFALSYLF